MVKEVNCKEAGYEDCEFLIRDENEEELIDLVQQHSEQTHNTSVSREDVQAVMKEV
jgi:predicted small metal-binding protein